MKSPISASTVGHEFPWHFLWQHMNPCDHVEARVGAGPSRLIYTSVFFVLLFPVKHLNKYWSNLLSCRGKAITHIHTPV